MIRVNKKNTVKVVNDHGPMGFVLFMAYIGALVYFIQQSAGFWGFLFSFLKAAVWPAYIIHAVLGLLHI